ncbi:hypothetical protein [Cellulomonas sp. PhB150]|uniref:hypothetical protein n=1 Tax=Cellulomonas sp. PhB150 TaxID=2485188 RepID=UPI000F46AE09|nr:hypothetical protein [Cellulomonas sp. PhB150]ROS31101.1 hypothetical protein EDF34_0753 [Cellulomonas sp. PhB150]
MSQLEDVVDDLYSGPLSEFVARRTAAVKAARSAKDRGLATAIGELRKPTVSAWLANLLVRDQPDVAEQIVALGAGLREAERSLDGPALRQLSSQRRQLVRSMVARARTLAQAEGAAVGESAVHELETTLAAALADPETAREVVSGRLTGPREHVGFGGTDASEQSASTPSSRRADTPAPTPTARAGGRLRLVGDAERAPKATGRTPGLASGPSPEEHRRARREERERRVRDEARAAWEQADRAVQEALQRTEAAAGVRDESAAQTARAEEAAERAHASEEDLVEELAEVRRRLTAAGKAATAADKALATSQQTLRADEKDVAAADRALRRAQDQLLAAAESLDQHA